VKIRNTIYIKSVEDEAYGEFDIKGHLAHFEVREEMRELYQFSISGLAGKYKKNTSKEDFTNQKYRYMEYLDDILYFCTEISKTMYTGYYMEYLAKPDLDDLKKTRKTTKIEDHHKKLQLSVTCSLMTKIGNAFKNKYYRSRNKLASEKDILEFNRNTDEINDVIKAHEDYIKELIEQYDQSTRAPTPLLETPIESSYEKLEDEEKDEGDIEEAQQDEQLILPETPNLEHLSENDLGQARTVLAETLNPLVENLLQEDRENLH